MEKSNLKIIAAPKHISLYEESGFSFLKSLELLLDQDEVEGVLIYQSGDADDFSQTWLRELHNDLLYDVLRKRLFQTREILRKIKFSKIPIAYAATGSVLGSHWELALSCDERYIFAEPQAKLGFPEIPNGAFPPGGLVETVGRKPMRSRDRLSALPVADLNYALEKGIIQFFGTSEDTENWALTLFSRRIAHITLKLPEQRLPNSDSNVVPGTFETVKSDRPWQIIWEVLKSQKDASHDEFICGTMSRFFLSSLYSRWLEGCINTAPFKQNLSERKVFTGWQLLVDLDHQIPPTSVLKRMRDSGLRVVFCGTESKQLSQSLDVLWSRLDKDLTGEATRRFWNERVSWFAGGCYRWNGPLLRFFAGDYVGIKVGTSERRLFRLSGNERSSRLGVVEYSGKEPLDDFVPYLPLFSRIVVQTQTGQNGLMTHWVRSLFFEELLRISQHYLFDPFAGVETLKGMKWGFAGDVEGWDTFLRTREVAAELSSASDDSEGKISEIGSMRHAKAMLKQIRKNEKNPTLWSATELSNHMAMYSGLLSLVMKDSCPQVEYASLLTNEALGFPDVLGSPDGYLRHRGRKRVRAYSKNMRLPADQNILETKIEQLFQRD